MIACPAQKVEESPDYEPSCIPQKGVPAAQGLVSWATCIKCYHNKGSNRKKFTIRCGFSDKVVELESLSL